MERIYYDAVYWDILYEEIVKFIETKINPLLGYLNTVKLSDILSYGLNMEFPNDNSNITFPIPPVI